MSNVRKFESLETETLLHGSVIPGEVRGTEIIKARVKSLDPKVPFHHELTIWKLSPLGIELVVSNFPEIQNGLHISIEIQMGLQKTFFSGLVVGNIIEEKGRMIAHVRLVTESERGAPNTERRRSTRWLCSDQFAPTAVASNPAKFNDFIYFKIFDISAGGFKLRTSLRNKFIIPGIHFDSIVNFPMVGQVNIGLTVRNTKIETENGREVLSIGVTYDYENKIINKVVGQYLLQFGSGRSLEELKKEGFQISKLSGAVEYSYVQSKEEFEDVLKLRFEAYKDAGKIAIGKTWEDMTDSFDSKSRIIIGKYKGEIISSARIIFHQLGETMEQERFVKWPTDLPRQDEVVEIMRACTRPDFRGGDLLLGMFKYMAIIVAQAKKEWIVICATDNMVPFYEKIGFKKVGLSYEHTGLNNQVHHVMLANFLDGMAGRTCGPIYWNLVWSEAVEYLSQYELIPVDSFMQIRLTIYKWFAPIAKFFYKKKLNKRN